jgi:hypothetical protein
MFHFAQNPHRFGRKSKPLSRLRRRVEYPATYARMPLRLVTRSLLLSLLLALAPVAGAQSSATGEWTWMSGSSIVGTGGMFPPGIYGTLGTAAPGNVPGGRFNGMSWTDSNKDLWLMGGEGFDANGASGELGDLWEYDPAINEWTWWSGSNSVAVAQLGVYGTLGVTAAANVPGGRQGGRGWADSTGNLWLYGGTGSDSVGTGGALNDLWRYSTSTHQWTWMAGSSTIPAGGGVPAVYGTMGTAAAGNTPGGRYEASTWIDTSGNLWLFGGQLEANNTVHTLNDLWEFNTTSGQWTWIGGSSVNNAPGVYGTKGTASATNVPGARSAALSWTDSSGNFWLFGGNVYNAAGNDLWKYSPSSGEWTWVSGSNSASAQPGVYGTEGVPAAGNIPGGHAYSVGWIDASDNLWFMGGEGVDSNGKFGYMNDLWEFNSGIGQWTWMGGSSTLSCTPIPGSPTFYTCSGIPGVYGTLGTPAAGNIPGSGDAAFGFSGGNGNFWLFGGGRFDAANTFNQLNDLWEYQPPSAATTTAATPTFSVPGGTYPTAQSVSITDSTPGATIYYTTNGDAPTTTSNIYSAGTPVLISSTQTLEAIATATGYSTSAVQSATYTITQAATTPTVTVTPSSATFTTAQTLTVSVAVSGGAGSPIPTGSITLTSLVGLTNTVYTSSAVNLVNGAASFSIPPGTLALGQQYLIATYTPDSASAATYNNSAGTTQVTDSAAYIFSGSQSFGTVVIGQTSSPVTVNLTLAGSGTIGTISALTQGSPGMDFAVVSGGTCSVAMTINSNTNCTVILTFAPKYAGLRVGSVVLVDNAGNTVGSSEVNGIGSGPQVRVLPATPSLIGGGFQSPSGVAADGKGDIYVADAGNNAIKVVPVACLSASCVQSIGGGFNDPDGVAIDVYGNLFVADTGNLETKELLAANGYKTTNNLGGPELPDAVAVDASDNVFVAANDTGDEFPAQDGYSTTNALGGGINNPPLGEWDSAYSIAVDPNGNVFTGDLSLDLTNGSLSEIPVGCASGNCIRTLTTDGFFYAGVTVDGGGNVYATNSGNQVNEFLATGDFSTIQTLSANLLKNPFGIALDGPGNLYVADTSGLHKLDTADGGLLNFPTATAAGTTDTTDGAELITVENIGNAPMTVSSFTQPGSGFWIDASKTTCANSISLAAGASCAIGVIFAPATSSPVTSTIVITDNTLNQTGTTQVVTLTGNGAVAMSKITPSVTVTPAQSSITATQSLSVTVTVAGGGSNPTPTGSVTLSSGSYTSAATTLTSGSATINIPAGSLATGADTLTVSYSPDANSSSTYSSANGTSTVNVTAAAVQITVGTTPSGLSFSVDGTVYTSTQTLSWTPGSSHTIATASPQISSGTRDTFGSWSDGGALSHSVTAPSTATTYTATFSTTYQLTTAASPSTDGSVTPVSGSYYAAGSQITVTATPASGFVFSSWTGSVASATNATTTVTMSGPESVTANFVAMAAPSATLTPPSLTFTSTTGTSSTAQTAQLTNTGNAALTISSIAIGGANPTDFAETNTCGSTLAAGASCQISITFTPASAAGFSANLQVTDNAAGATQTISLTGTGTAPATFSVSSSTGVQTVDPGGTATYSITVTSQNGTFSNAVALSASGLPAGATSTFSPSSSTPGSTPATSTLSIKIPATSASLRHSSIWPLAAPALAFLCLVFVPGRRRPRWTSLALLLFASLGALGAFTGCGGGFGITQPAQTYAITVTGTSGTDIQSTTVQLTVQ